MGRATQIVNKLLDMGYKDLIPWDGSKTLTFSITIPEVGRLTYHWKKGWQGRLIDDIEQTPYKNILADIQKVEKLIHDELEQAYKEEFTEEVPF